MTPEPLAARTKGKYQISVGTSVAFEHLLGVADVNPVPKSQAAFNEYDGLVINVQTMARNFLGSISSNGLPVIPKSSLFKEFLEELVLIPNIIDEETDGKLKVKYYYNNYANIKRVLRDIDLRTSFAPKKTFLLGLEVDLCMLLLQIQPRQLESYFDLEITGDRITSNYRRNLLMTHLAPDLLLSLFDKNLFESHTGRIKKPFEFSTKLKKPGNELPFNKFTLQIFGDNSGFVNSKSSAIKSDVMKICRESGVTQVTGEKRFYKLMKKLGNPDTRTAISRMK